MIIELDLLHIKQCWFPSYTMEEFDSMLWTCTAYPACSTVELAMQLRHVAHTGNDHDQAQYIANGWEDLMMRSYS